VACDAARAGSVRLQPRPASALLGGHPVQCVGLYLAAAGILVESIALVVTAGSARSFFL
jgi:hypothetical protein